MEQKIEKKNLKFKCQNLDAVLTINDTKSSPKEISIKALDFYCSDPFQNKPSDLNGERSIKDQLNVSKITYKTFITIIAYIFSSENQAIVIDKKICELFTLIELPIEKPNNKAALKNAKEFIQKFITNCILIKRYKSNNKTPDKPEIQILTKKKESKQIWNIELHSIEKEILKNNENERKPVNKSREIELTIRNNEPIKIDGAIIIDNFFIEDTKNGRHYSMSEFYTAKHDDTCQWYGIINGYDIRRKDFDRLKQIIETSFLNFQERKISAIIHGDGGSGKSTLLRKLAIDTLSDDYTTLWVDHKEFNQWDNYGIKYIAKNTTVNFLIFVEDWYRLTSNSRNKTRKFIDKCNKLSNIRLVIGDRVIQHSVNGIIKPKYYIKNLYNLENCIELSPKENEFIIGKILDKNSDWKEIGNRIFSKKEVYQSTLFLLLFVLSRAYEHYISTRNYNYSEPQSEFIEIIRHDFKLIYEEYPGVAKMLYYWACIYSKFRISVSYNYFLQLADYFEDNKNKPSELFYNLKGDSSVHKKLRIYINTSKGSDNRERLKQIDFLNFNHDILADEGISKMITVLPQLENYNDLVKLKLCQATLNVKGEDYSVSVFLAKMIEYESQIFKDDEHCLSFVRELIENNNQEYLYIDILNKRNLHEKALHEFMKYLNGLKRFPDRLWTYYINRFPEKIEFLLVENHILELPHQLASLALNKLKNNDLLLLKEKCEEVLNNPKFPYITSQVLCASLNRLQGNKVLLKTKCEAILNNNEIFAIDPFDRTITALKRLNGNDALVFKKCKQILNTPNYYDVFPHDLISLAMKTIEYDKNFINHKYLEILNKNEFYKLPPQIVCSTLNNFNADKLFLRQKCHEVLKVSDFYFQYYLIVSTAMKRLDPKDYILISKSKEVLNYPDFFKEIHFDIITTALKVMKTDYDFVRPKCIEILDSKDYLSLAPQLVVEAIKTFNDKDPFLLVKSKEILSTPNFHQIDSSIVTVAFIKLKPDYGFLIKKYKEVLNIDKFYLNVSSNIIETSLKQLPDNSKLKFDKAKEIIIASEKLVLRKVLINLANKILSQK